MSSPPADWSRVERQRVDGQNRIVMVTSENDRFLTGYILRRDTDGDLDFQTIPGEDLSSRVLFLAEKISVTRRTLLRQDRDTGQWKNAQ